MNFKTKTKAVLSLTVATLLVASVVAIGAYDRQKESELQKSQTSQSQKQWSQQHQQMQQQSQQLGLVTGKKLMDAKVVSSSGSGLQWKSRQQSKTTHQQDKQKSYSESESLGKVEELILNDSQDTVRYVIVSSEGKHYPVPWAAFDKQCMQASWKSQQKAPQEKDQQQQTQQQKDSGRQEEYVDVQGEKESKSDWSWWSDEEQQKQHPLCLKLTKQQFKQAPTIDAVEISTLNDTSLMRRVCDFYSEHTQGKMGQTMEMSRQRQFAQQVIGGADLCKFSEIKGLEVQNFENEQIAQIDDVVIDASQGSLAYGLVSYGGFAGIGDKLAAIPWSAMSLRIDQGYAMLDATEDELQQAQIEKGNIQKLSQRQFARSLHQNFETEPYWDVFLFVPTDLEQARAPWRQQSWYNQKFQEGQKTSIKGTIRNVGFFRPEQASVRGLRLQVKTDQGESMTVYAGPALYARRQGIQPKAGDQVAVQGSKTEIDGKQVILASEIEVTSKLKLRDQQGKPHWKEGQIDEDTSEMQGMQQQQQDQDMEDE